MSTHFGAHPSDGYRAGPARGSLSTTRVCSFVHRFIPASLVIICHWRFATLPAKSPAVRDRASAEGRARLAEPKSETPLTQKGSFPAGRNEFALPMMGSTSVFMVLPAHITIVSPSNCSLVCQSSTGNVQIGVVAVSPTPGRLSDLRASRAVPNAANRSQYSNRLAQRRMVS